MCFEFPQRLDTGKKPTRRNRSVVLTASTMHPQWAPKTVWHPPLGEVESSRRNSEPSDTPFAECRAPGAPLRAFSRLCFSCHS